jgi:hypothetical protein
MSAALLAVASFVTGLFVGVVVAAHDEVRNRPRRHDDDLSRNWREGQAYGKREGIDEGYVAGWTAGRVALLGEQEAQRHHPTAHPTAVLRQIEDRASDLWGED